ncbi:msx2-interacting protein-like isoform X2 [Neocloeon triangulifer]|uniref:msx2-interacting protein-like isoform X2 n=1 Tax=Neocloeon triangulifer TaxID=2078957 RepID=UPI00286EB99D|nr:msx2-interacting protein-like isoform X2 [Neocloeon triangulifer]
MAPCPEDPQGNEPKAPDKTAPGAEEATPTRDEAAAPAEDAEHPSADQREPPKPANVSHMNDGQLKALLDEAYSYKSPKDRVGKSEIFNELLKKVETTDEDSNVEPNLPFTESRFGVNKRRLGNRREKGGSERQSHSLQNINQCHQGDPPARRHGPHQFRRGASTSSTCSSVTSESVSTRQREGGSLPCSVNDMQYNFPPGDYSANNNSVRGSLEDLRSFSMQPRQTSQEPRRSTNSPLGTELTTFETAREDKSYHMQSLQLEKQMIESAAAKHIVHETFSEPAAASYKTYATFNVSKDSEEVDKGINIIRSFQRQTKILMQQHPSETFSLGMQQETPSVTSLLDGKPSPSITTMSSILKSSGKPATKLPTGVFNSKVDENENVAGANSESSNSQKKKKKKDTTVPSEDIEGFVGDKPLDYLIKYIGEGATNKGSKVALTNDLKHKEPKHEGGLSTSRRSQRYSEDGKKDQQKQSAKMGRKGVLDAGRNKIKRANSYEEVSQSKREELTIQPYCRSIGGEDRTSEASKDLDYDEEEYNRMLDEQNGNASVKSEDFQGNLTGSDFPDNYSDSNIVHNEDSFEFQTVTNSKKQRRKKQKVAQDHPVRHSYIRGGSMGYEEEHYQHHHHYPHHSVGRRKLKSTSSMPPSDQSGAESSDDCDSVHSMPASSRLPSTTSSAPDHSATMSYAAIARNPPPPPPPAAAATEENWPQVAEETASSSISSTTTEPNTPPEEPLNVLGDYYPSLAESYKGGSRKASEEPPPVPPKLPNGDVKRQSSLPPKNPPAPAKAKSVTPPVSTRPLKRVPQNQPPVIFDEKTLCSDSVEGLTFGFSVNPSLMDEASLVLPPQLDCAPVLAPPPPPTKQKVVSSPTARVEVAATIVAPESDLPTTKKTKDFSTMFRPPPQSSADYSGHPTYNQMEIINFVGNAWALVTCELNKESPNSRSIHYFYE